MDEVEFKTDIFLVCCSQIVSSVPKSEQQKKKTQTNNNKTNKTKKTNQTKTPQPILKNLILLQAKSKFSSTEDNDTGNPTAP